ncbi:Fut8 [Symbiodinium sp. CCMP2592]|nr:Fut8 [Symbiodinium sp. CCMP2592]
MASRQGVQGFCFLAALTVGYVLGYLHGIGSGTPCQPCQNENELNWSELTTKLSTADPEVAEGETPIWMPQEGPFPAPASYSSTPKRDTGTTNGKKCSEYENVDVPLDGWPVQVRASGGEALYGTGWAQRFLREHQFPHDCTDKSFVEHGMFRSGMGSNIHISADPCPHAVLAFALDKGSIYLWPEDDWANPWTRGKQKGSTVQCPGGIKATSYECYLKPVSSCVPTGKGPRFIGVKRDRGKEELRGTEVVPRVFKELLRCSRYPKNYWIKWWRAQTAAFLVRPSSSTLDELQNLRKGSLVGEMQDAVLGSYVRHGDKYYEAKEYEFKDYMHIYSWILRSDAEVERRCPDASRMLAPFKKQLPRLRAAQRLYLGSDDPTVLEEASRSFSCSGCLVYMNVSRLSKRRPLMEVQKLLGAKQMVMESLLNLQLLMESDAFVCTWTSNWCRLVDELRMTVALKANHLSLEVNKRCPRFNWVHGGGAETPDYR